MHFRYEGQDVYWVGNYTGSFGVINQGRFYEQPFLEAVRGLGLRGTYLDIGTNVGTHVVYFGLFCADRVIGFEPVERCAAVCAALREAALGAGFQIRIRIVDVEPLNRQPRTDGSSDV